MVMEDRDPARLDTLFRDVPCSLRFVPSLGRYLVADRDLTKNEVILRSQAIVTGLLPSWKKRVCRNCFTTHPARLSISCRKCNQAWYCSEECRSKHTTGSGADTGWQLPHASVCAVLRFFSGCKADAEIQSVLFMCLDALAQKGVEIQSGAGPAFSFQDILSLQSHAEDMNPRDSREWKKGINFLLTAMRRSGWEAELPDAIEVLDLAGRICSNNFGMWLTHYGAVTHGLQAATQAPVEAAAAVIDTQADPAISALKQQDATLLSEGGISFCHQWPVVGSGAGQSANEGQPPRLLSQADRKDSKARSEVDIREWALHAEDQVSSARTEPIIPDLAASPALVPSNLYLPAENSGEQLGKADFSPRITDASSESSIAELYEIEDKQPEASISMEDGALPKETLIGRELFITASFFNHSCDPNCIMSRPFSGRRARGIPDIKLSTAVVSPLRDIKAGEELTISYIDLHLPVSARRESLKQGFFFDCFCNRCQEELKNGRSAKCTYIRSKQGKEGKDFTPKRRGRKARTSRC